MTTAELLEQRRDATGPPSLPGDWRSWLPNLRSVRIAGRGGGGNRAPGATGCQAAQRAAETAPKTAGLASAFARESRGVTLAEAEQAVADSRTGRCAGTSPRGRTPSPDASGFLGRADGKGCLLLFRAAAVSGWAYPSAGCRNVALR